MANRTVTVRTFSGEQSTGEISTESFSQGERTRRALIRTGTALLITALSALVPVAHFVTVPVGIIATIVIFIKNRSTSVLVTGGDITCPACQNKITLFSRSLKTPLKDCCDHCHREVIILLTD